MNEVIMHINKSGLIRMNRKVYWRYFLCISGNFPWWNLCI